MIKEKEWFNILVKEPKSNWNAVSEKVCVRTNSGIKIAYYHKLFKKWFILNDDGTYSMTDEVITEWSKI